MPVRGIWTQVPCPHCTKRMDISELEEHMDDGITFKCDHCEKLIRVEDFEETMLVTLEKAE